MSDRLDNSFPTIITFSENPTIKLWEKEVTPPGISTGGPINTTTHRNTAWKTKAAKVLKDLTDATLVCAYAVSVYDEIMAMIGVNQTITVTFSDGSELAFWGYLDEFTPGALSAEEEQPTADVKLVATNQDTSGTEQPPTFTEAA